MIAPPTTANDFHPLVHIPRGDRNPQTLLRLREPSRRSD
ncbi:hypothetical protein HMPREF1503_1977 [Olsenella uli MSTE5]|nr:hypothetical protein HMPREF1503_1977 [Olsenella uli MSTE5]